MNEQKNIQFGGTGFKNNRLKVTQPDSQNEPIINCFYNSQFYPCSFATSESKVMESHYRQKHYQKEVNRG